MENKQYKRKIWRYYNERGALIDFQYSSINFLRNLQQSKYFLYYYEILNCSFISSNKNKIFK